MYYTVGSQCPKIPIPDRVPIAELFSSEWLLLNLNSFSQDLPLCHFYPCQREESDRILALAWNLGQWQLAASLGMSTSIQLTSAFSSDQKGILFTADSRSSNVALASAISFVLFYLLIGKQPFSGQLKDQEWPQRKKTTDMLGRKRKEMWPKQVQQKVLVWAQYAIGSSSLAGFMIC